MGFFRGQSGSLLRVRCLIWFAPLALASPVLALDGSWDVDASGDWSVTTNWAGGVVGTGNGFTATFANNITADRTVTLDTTRAVGSLVFGDADPTSAANWVLNRSGTTQSFTLNNGTSSTSFISVNDTMATISLLVGSGANAPIIEKNGSGTLVFTGNNPFAAKLAVSAGSLQVSADNQLGGTGTFATDRITLSGGGTLKTTAGFTLNSNRGITLGAGGGVLNLSGGNLTTSIPFSGAGETLTVMGANGLVASNARGIASSVNWDFAGNSGTRVFFSGSDAIGTGSLQIGSGVRFVTQSSAPAAGQVPNVVTLADGGGISARNSGGAVEYTNVTFPASGTVVLNKDDQLTAALTISSGGTLTGDLSVDTSQQAGNAVGDVTLSGVFAGTGGITKLGTGVSGKLILGGVNTYSGNTTISTGTLALGANGSIDNSPLIVMESGTSFDVSALAGSFSLGASQELSGVGTVVGDLSASGTLSPGLAGGTGTMIFSNALALASGSSLSFQLDGANPAAGGPGNDLVDALGDLTLGGTLSVTESVSNSFLGANVGDTWRILNYAGTLTNNGLSLGTMPTLPAGLSFSLNTTTANQVNLEVVPEPTTLAVGIIGLGWVALAAVRRGRRSG